LLAVVGVLLPALVASHYGALDIPRADDWSYLLTLFHWVDSGKLTFNGWVSMTLVGQIAITAPLAAITGRDITAIHLFTALIGLVGLVAVVVVGRQVGRTSWGVLVAATIAVGPIWGPLAPTFMTDIPTFTVEMLAVAAACAAFRRRPLSLGWFAVSMAIGFLGVSIRQYAIVPPLAIALIGICMVFGDRDWKRMRALVAISALCGVASLALVAWWSGLPDSKSLSPTLPDVHSISAMLIKDAGFLRLVGLLIIPVIVFAGPVAIARRAWHASASLTVLLGTLTTAWLAAMYLHVPKTPFAGAYVTRDGVLSNFVIAGKRPDLVPSEVYGLFILVGSIGGILIVLAAVPFVADLPRRYRERELIAITDPLAAVLGLTVVGFAAAYSLVVVTGLPVYDRYALPLLPLVGLLVLRSTRVVHPADATDGSDPAAAPVPAPADRSRVVGAGIAIVLLAVVGLVYTADSASFDGTRWKLDEAVVGKGYAPTEIAGGAEWLGYHRQHGPVVKTSDSRTQSTDQRFALPCVTVVVNPPHPGRRKIAEADSKLFFRDPVRIIAHRNHRPCKP
jgi:hypothetical protein